MRIMLIEHYAGSDYYGMEFRPYYMAREWVKAGHEVVIVAADYTHLRKINPKIQDDFTEELIDNITFVWIKTPEYHGNNFGRAKNIGTFVKKLWLGASKMADKYKPEAVIASSTYPLDIYPAARIAKKASAGLFFEIHDLWPLTPMEMGNLPWWNPLIMLLQAGENYAYEHTDRIISILPNADEYIKLRGYDNTKFVHVPNGVIPSDANTTLTDDPQVGELKSLHDEGWFLVGYTGNHSISNSLEYFLDSSELLKEHKVKIVLVGNGNFKQELVARAKQKGLDNVLFLEPVPKKSMGAVLSLLDVCYMGLSKSSLFMYGVSPNKLYDYLLAKKPVIYAVEASNDPVKLSKCGITIPVGNSQKIADAIIKLQSLTKQEREQMGQNGFDYVLKNHNYDKLAKKYSDALDLSKPIQ
jgi:glycosyltransferase involved in cell wall biosynthesis